MQRTRSSRAIVLGILTLAAGACSKPHGRSRATTAEGDPRSPPGEPTSRTTTLSVELAAEPARGAMAVEPVPVPDDRDVLVVVGDAPARPIVYLHGMCSGARSDLEAWAADVKAYGTIIGLSGDVRCPARTSAEPPRWSWTSDPAALDARISAAIDAVRAARSVPLDPGAIVVIGESMGAARATALAGRFHAKYTRLVLVGGPELPSLKDLRHATAIALLAGEREDQTNMREGARVLERGGLSARFWVLPDATHGTYGAEGGRRMGEAVAFVVMR